MGRGDHRRSGAPARHCEHVGFDGRPTEEAVERQRDQARLVASEEKFRALSEHMTDVVLEIDRSGNLVWASPSFEDALGIAPESVIGGSMAPLIHPDDIIVDALFGIGLNRAPEGWVKALIQYLNGQAAFRLSIDIPSGLPANLPVPDREAVIRANHTLTFQAPKLKSG